MSIRWDSLLVRHLVRELDELLDGTRLRAFRLDGERRDLLLLFREHTLLWRLHPTRGRVLLYPPREPAEDDHRLASKVRRVAAPPDERMVRFELLPVRGRRGPTDLVVELLGNQWNAAVVEADTRRIRHVLVTGHGSRKLAVGDRYEPPEPSPREGRDGALSRERWLEVLGDVPEDQRTRALVSSVAWTSRVNAPAILEAAPDADDERSRLLEGHRLWCRLAGEDRPTEAVVLETEKGLQPYPAPLPGIPATPAGSLLDAFSAAGGEEEAGGGGRTGDDAAAALVPPGVVSALEDAVARTAGRADSLRTELEGLGDAEELRARGDLILARFGEIPPGASEVTLDDFQGRSVTVELDPGLSPNENADAFYDRAGRVERARERLPALIRQTEERVRALQTLLERVRAGDAGEEEIRAALPRKAFAPDQTRPSRGPSLPYRVYRSAGGLEIRVGRGAKHNDDLTFHHSAPDDVWLHARHASGAHVILRWSQEGNPPARDLTQAAILAALNSKARTSGSVPVDWTRRKYVRKPRKAPPGAVVPQRVETVFVTPDPAVEEALREPES